MCITPEEVRKIVHDELDNKLVSFMERVNSNVNACVDAKVLHIQQSPKTVEDIRTINTILAKHEILEEERKKQLDKIQEMLQANGDALQTVSDFLAGGRLVRGLAKLVTAIGIIFAGFAYFKGWIKT